MLREQREQRRREREELELAEYLPGDTEPDTDTDSDGTADTVLTSNYEPGDRRLRAPGTRGRPIIIDIDVSLARAPLTSVTTLRSLVYACVLLSTQACWTQD